MYQNIGFHLKGRLKVRLTNKYEFTALDEFSYSKWLQDGELVKSGEVPLSRRSFGYSAFTGSQELFLNVFAKLKQSTCWAEKGFVISKEQFW